MCIVCINYVHGASVFSTSLNLALSCTVVCPQSNFDTSASSVRRMEKNVLLTYADRYFKRCQEQRMRSTSFSVVTAVYVCVHRSRITGFTASLKSEQFSKVPVSLFAAVCQVKYIYHIFIISSV